MAMSHWYVTSGSKLIQVANERVHGTTGVRPSDRLRQERPHLQLIPAPWRADIAAARPQTMAVTGTPATPARPAAVAQHMAQEVPLQHPLAVYEQLLLQITLEASA